LGEQFGDDGVKFTMSGLPPSTRICIDSVLGEMYSDPTFFGFGVIPIAKLTLLDDDFAVDVADRSKLESADVPDISECIELPLQPASATATSILERSTFRDAENFIDVPHGGMRARQRRAHRGMMNSA